MPRIYKLSRTGLKIIYKIRHHRGHGIHSPFVFNLINKVIEEKTPYHVYDDIRAHLKSICAAGMQLTKENLLSFRLVNYFNAKKILEIGSGKGINTLCLTAPSAQIQCICIETDARKYTNAQKLYEIWDRDIVLYTDKIPDISDPQDCIFIDMNSYNRLDENIIKKLCESSDENTFIVLKGIRTNRHNQMLWRSIKNIDSRTIALDLFDIGIIFFDKKLYKWSYQISF